MTRLVSNSQVSWNEKGELKTRDAFDIFASTWSIGGETLDRGYADYQSYKPYLSPLGAKKIRLQGGWARCEKVKAEGNPGKYDFAWLDAIIPDAANRGVSPWVNLSYGNPIYPGGGEATLHAHIPTSPEALVAWDNWVKAIVSRYQHQVIGWEIWNEPEVNLSHTGAEIADFYLRTAKVIKSVQPNAKLFALGFSKIYDRLSFVEDFMVRLKELNELKQVDVFTYHGYIANPDESYTAVEKLMKLVWKYNPMVQFMQGENGAPSMPKGTSVGALTEQDWSELTQSKWNLRRMLGDHGRGIATNLFTISDIHYATGDHLVGLNAKGLLKTNPDKTIDRPKKCYSVAQRVFSLFDSQLVLNPLIKIITTGNSQSFFAYKHYENNYSLVTIWQKENRPLESYLPKQTTISVENGSFRNPVWVDLISGKIYEVPKANWKKKGKSFVFTDIPVYDYPTLITDASIVLSK